MSTLHLVAGVARVGRAEGEDEEGAARRRKKKMRLTKICADTKVTLFSGKRTRNFFVILITIIIDSNSRITII